MPLLRPSNSDYVAFVKAAASNPAGGGTLSRASVGAEAVLGRGAAVRASYAGAKSSPASSVVQLFGPIAAAVAAFIDVWLNKTAVVTTLTGSLGLGTADGTLAAGRFRQPKGVAVLPNGDIVVADTLNHRIRLITDIGIVSTIAGSTGGFNDGIGTDALFNNPIGIAGLPNGNIVVADTNNNRIRLITMPGGVVTTLAGDGTDLVPVIDGIGTNATFRYPEHIAVLPNGNIAICDTFGYRIRLITMPGGVVTTLAGSGSGASVDGIGTNASFSSPCGIALRPNGDFVVTDRTGKLIRLVTSAGVVTTLAGSTSGSANGTGTNATFYSPSGIAVLPNGNFVVSDSSNNLIRLVTPGGVVTTLAGNGTSTIFSEAQGIAVFPNGNIVVADNFNHRIRLITPTG
jgi:sulfur carrier protein ThiS/sugar lactone lactonase YvrE